MVQPYTPPHKTIFQLERQIIFNFNFFKVYIISLHVIDEYQRLKLRLKHGPCVYGINTVVSSH